MTSCPGWSLGSRASKNSRTSCLKLWTSPSNTSTPWLSARRLKKLKKPARKPNKKRLKGSRILRKRVLLRRRTLNWRLKLQKKPRRMLGKSKHPSSLKRRSCTRASARMSSRWPVRQSKTLIYSNLRRELNRRRQQMKRPRKRVLRKKLKWLQPLKKRVKSPWKKR